MTPDVIAAIALAVFATGILLGSWLARREVREVRAENDALHEDIHWHTLPRETPTGTPLGDRCAEQYGIPSLAELRESVASKVQADIDWLAEHDDDIAALPEFGGER